MKTTLTLLTTAAAAALALAAGASASRSPGEFLKAQYGYVLLHQWGREWQTLHPAQQKLVGRDAYAGCAEDKAPAGSYSIAAWKVLDSYRERVKVPGTTVREPSTAVTFRLTLKDADTGKKESLTTTSHVFSESGGYRWVLTSDWIKACLSED